MNFIRGMLGLVDDVWSLWTIPAYLLFAFFVIMVFPIIGLFFLFFFIGFKIRYISYAESVATKYNTKSDNKYEDVYNPYTADMWSKKARAAQLDIILAIIISVIVTVFMVVTLTGSYYDMCTTTDIVPWSLIDILRTFTKINC